MSTDKNKKPEFRGWVNINLTDSDKAGIKHLAEKPEEQLVRFWDWAASLIYQGWKISVSWDSYSDAYQPAVFCWDKNSDSCGYAVSARHPDLTIALLSLYWKVTEIADHNLADYTEMPSVDSWG